MSPECQPNPAELDQTLRTARQRLLAEFANGHWTGQLCSSALATATAVGALALAGDESHRPMIRAGLNWLAGNQNKDGGWGDSPLSHSNISATLLCWSAYALAGDEARHKSTLFSAQTWLLKTVGSLAPADLAAAVTARYGKDRTFAVPILATCALAGRLGEPEAAWALVPELPFELAVCPHRWFKRLKLPVVSYALPALIALGQLRFRRRPPANPLMRLVRLLALKPTLRVLAEIQPSGGGFLEATPLTGFVAMSLAGAGRKDHPVARRAVEFVVKSVRPDGSWPIDTNLSTWVSTLAVNALAAGGAGLADLPAEARRQLCQWLLGQQYRQEHPYTHAAPGGWAWNDLPGAVPDADDTAGALLALRSLSVAGVSPASSTAVPAVSSMGVPPMSSTGILPVSPTGVSPVDSSFHDAILDSATRGVEWLLDMQNRDGGMPTFCRGWGKLPFDRSGADLTAHALRAWLAWDVDLPIPVRVRLTAAIQRAIQYLLANQRQGHWLPLWFGNQDAPAEENPVFGTAKVLPAVVDALAYTATQSATAGQVGRRSLLSAMLLGSAGWLLSAQNADGGWGGATGGERAESAGVASGIEETSLAVSALATVRDRPDLLSENPLAPRLETAIAGGINWLIAATDRAARTPAAPIGFYFAKLWYFEKLYPLIFLTEACSRALSPRKASR